MLADVAIGLNAARLGIHQVAASADPLLDPLLAAQAKVFASEMVIRVTNDALQMFSARGYSRGFPMERLARDARKFIIGGGAAQVLRNFLARKVLWWMLPQTRQSRLGRSEIAPEIDSG
jgi:alkylation response protein AidB-like acyl-CoA dehydrogenase